MTQTRTQSRNPVRGVLTTRGHAFVAAGLTLMVGGLVLGFTDVTRVGVLLLMLPLVAAIRARPSKSGIEVSRTVRPTRVVVDRSARVTLVLRNTSSRPSRPQLAEERFHNPLGDRPRFVLPAMEPGDIREVEYQLRSQVRGRYRLGPLTLRRQDPYGLTRSTTTLPGVTDILVLPHIESLGHGAAHTNGLGAEGASRHMVSLHGEDDVAVRSYRDGDDLRRIHWPSTAHRSELMVRQEDHPTRRRAVIVLDSRTSGHHGAGARGSFEWAVSATGSIAAHLCENEYTLHLATSETTAGGQAPQTADIDHAMACLSVAQLGTSRQFDEVLGWAHPVTSTGGLVIAVVTDLDEDALRRTAALRQPEGTGLLILLDSATFAYPRPGPATSRTQALADMVSQAGWSTCVVGSGMTVAQAWEIVSARRAFMAGGAS